MKFLTPPNWPRPKGYSNGIVARGQMVFLAGIIGWNEREEFDTDDFAGQARQCFANITALLDEAGAKPEHLVRLAWYVRDRDEYMAAGKALGAAYREYFSQHYPGHGGHRNRPAGRGTGQTGNRGHRRNS